MFSLETLSNLLSTVAIVGVLFYCYSNYFLQLVAILYARYYLYSTNTNTSRSDVREMCQCSPVGVTIIKPLCGLDPNLRDNLQSLFHMDYPTYEILFCVMDPTDPVCQLVETLLHDYPTVDARLLHHAVPVGVNMKVNNMNQGYQEAKYELILISDSGIYMRHDTLADMVRLITSDPQIAMIHQLPYLATSSYSHPHLSTLSTVTSSPAPASVSHPTPPLSSSTEEVFALFNTTLSRAVQLVYFGCWHARMYLCAALLRISCTSGMSCLIRKHALQQAGGLQAFANYLAEDFFISKFMFEHKWRVVLAHQPAWQNSVSSSLTQFHARLARWQQLRLMMTPFTTMLEPLTNGVPVVCIVTFMWYLLHPSLQEMTVWIYVIHLLAWISLDYVLLQQVHPHDEPTPITKWTFLQGWFYREFVTVPTQMKYLFHTRVTWRGHSYRLQFGGKVVPEDVSSETRMDQPSDKVPLLSSR